MYKSLAFIFSLGFVLVLVLCLYMFDRVRDQQLRCGLLEQNLQNTSSALVFYVQKAAAGELRLSSLSNRVSELTREYDLCVAALQKKLALYAGPSSNRSAASIEALGYQRYAEGLAALIESREMLLNTRSRLEDQRVNPVYGSFLKNTLTTSEDNQIVKDLLVDWYLLDWKKQIELMNPALSRSDRLALIHTTAAEQEAVDRKIKDRLGQELYNQFRAIQQSREAREFIAGFNSRLIVNSVEQLSDIQRKRLIPLIAGAIEAMRSRPDYIDFETVPIRQISEQQLPVFTDYHTELNQRLLAQTRSLLKPAQHQILQDYLQQNLEQQLTSLRFRLNMFQPQNGHQ